MKIPGYIKVQLLLLMILMISSVSSTALQIRSMVENTSEENIFMLLEPPRERSENRSKSLIGKNIMGLAQS